MTLNQFLSINRLKLSSDLLDLSNHGIEIMSRSKDPHHSELHIYGLLDDLHVVLKHEQDLQQKKVDIEVLLPALCWHDVWKSTRVQTQSLITLIYEQCVDGRESKSMFLNYLQTSHIPVKNHKHIAYCIKKHSRIFWLPHAVEKLLFSPRTLESQILRDMDSLQAWRIERLKNLKSIYFNNGSLVNPNYVKLAKFWFEQVVMKTNESIFNFEYSKRVFKKRKQKIIAEALKMWNEYTKPPTRRIG